jgi:multisubunit Na+/H+ antiporter MnhB subunit
MRPAFAAALGEGLVVIIEGTLIYLICRHVPAKQNLPIASLVRCWLISLAGNACSLIAFPLLTNLYDFISRHD